LEFETLIHEKNKQLEILENHNEQLRQENIKVHSRVISLENELKFAEEIKEQNGIKIKELRTVTKHWIKQRQTWRNKLHGYKKKMKSEKPNITKSC
jgi:hypothetical protein